MKAQHIINFSGGKDSTAIYLLAMESGREFRAIHCDTGHEHPLTVEYVHTLHEKTGGPKVEIIRADFTKDFARKRAFVLKNWEADGVPSDHVAEAARLLEKPTGNPFLDLCMMKGIFPSTMARFCTQELKVLPAMKQVVFPAAKAGPVMRWVGVRADESPARAQLSKLQRDDHPRVRIWRPILNWTAADVFAMHDRHGLEPNPLYKLGMGRVGCMPCIMARKSEISEIARRFPEEIDRVERWERLVATTSKRGRATMFAPDKTTDAPVDGVYPGIRQVSEWAKTSRGGAQYDLEKYGEPTACSSIYGLCE